MVWPPLHRQMTTVLSLAMRSDDEIIAACKAAGMLWIGSTPKGSDYLGPDAVFPSVTLQQIRALLDSQEKAMISATALKEPVTAPGFCSDGTACGLEGFCRTCPARKK